MDKIIDLTYDVEEEIIPFAPWHPSVSIQHLGTIKEVGRNTHKITLGSHTGTHMDAPLHFIEGGGSIDSIPVDKLIGPVTIVDFSHLGDSGCVTKKMLNGINITKKMLFYFNWSKHWKTEKFGKKFPFFSTEAAKYLVSKGLEMILLDTPSPDNSGIKLYGDLLGSEKDSPVHKIFLSKDIIIVEYLKNLHKIDDLEGWTIAALPMKIKGSDGAPARVILFK